MSSCPHHAFVHYLISGLKEGFRLGYEGPVREFISPNAKSASEYSNIVDTYIETEVAEGRIAGPFESQPFPSFRTNPLGIVPKKDSGKFRSILNLSYPRGSSVNDYIDKDDYSLSYVTIDTAIQHILELGRGCFLNKVDIKDAFRIVPVHPDDWHLLGIFWKDQYFFDLRLPMGSRSSPFIFNCLSTAIVWILINNYELDNVAHILDDFLMVEPPGERGNAMSVILYVFHILGIPVAPKKVVGPVNVIEFVGITLDTLLMEARLSPEKVSKLSEKLSYMLGRRKVTKKELLSLIGSLSFACKVVPPGRSFLSRMITLSCTVRENHFMINLNKSVKSDMTLWLTFLKKWNGRNFFLSNNVTFAQDLDFSTDAAGEVGHGGYLRGSWFALRWLPHQMGWSMPTKELFPIMIAANLWGSRWKQLRISVQCDNEPTVNMINKGYTSREPAASMLRLIMQSAMEHNFVLKSSHIPGKDNIIGDALSRFQFERFRLAAPEADEDMTVVPAWLEAFGK